MSMQVPEMTIARGVGLGPPPNAVYTGSPQPVGSLVALPPPPVLPTPGANRRQKTWGLIPAQAGGMHPLIVREKARVDLDPRRLSETRAALRRAEADQRIAESAWAFTAPHGGVGDAEKLKVAKDAVDRTAMLKRTLAEMEAAASSRPLRVSLAVVREPSEVADEIAKGETSYVCLHDGCKGQKWTDEASLRRAHPTHQEMQRSQQCHVFALLCEGPIDPLDPDGEQIGYVAPVGRDGTTVARAVEQHDAHASTADEMVALRAELAEMKALVADLAAKKRDK